MPLYEYKCPKCETEQNHVVPMAQRDDVACECGAGLERVEIPSAQVNLVDKVWKTGAILADGSKVQGSFGVGRSRNFKGFM